MNEREKSCAEVVVWLCACGIVLACVCAWWPRVAMCIGTLIGVFGMYVAGFACGRKFESEHGARRCGAPSVGEP